MKQNNTHGKENNSVSKKTAECKLGMKSRNRENKIRKKKKRKKKIFFF